jgi:hypothetical protein
MKTVVQVRVDVLTVATIIKGLLKRGYDVKSLSHVGGMCFDVMAATFVEDKVEEIGLATEYINRCGRGSLSPETLTFSVSDIESVIGMSKKEIKAQLNDPDFLKEFAKCQEEDKKFDEMAKEGKK